MGDVIVFMNWMACRYACKLEKILHHFSYSIGRVSKHILSSFVKQFVSSSFHFSFFGQSDQKSKKSAVIFRQNMNFLYRKYTNRTADFFSFLSLWPKNEKWYEHWMKFWLAAEKARYNFASQNHGFWRKMNLMILKSTYL